MVALLGSVLRLLRSIHHSEHWAFKTDANTPRRITALPYHFHRFTLTFQKIVASLMRFVQIPTCSNRNRAPDASAFGLTPAPFFREIKPRKDGGAVDRGGLENR